MKYFEPIRINTLNNTILVFQIPEGLLQIFVQLVEIGLNLGFTILNGVLQVQATSESSLSMQFRGTLP